MFTLALAAAGQLKGTLTVEGHPKLVVHECTNAGGCIPTEKPVVMDANWRWIHANGTSTNCYDGGAWDPTICPDVATCAKNCAIEGIAEASYREVYGVSADGETLRLNLVMPGNVGSRLYLLKNETHYELFKLKNAEISMTVDVSTLPCGVNGAVYFVQMDADGGASRFPGNEAGAGYGTGYCDAQCPHDAKFIDGEPNILDWGPVPGVPDSGAGRYGTCCVEMDLWEANSLATALTAHSCAATRQTRCESAADCGDDEQRYAGMCDKDGCDFQTYRLGNTSFYGPGTAFTLDTTRPFTLVTQFLTEDGTDDGKLVEIRRHYTQDSVTIPTPAIKVGPSGQFDSLSPAYCSAEHSYFRSNDSFVERGGFDSMGDALENGMVLVLSLWDDALSHMLWLDSTSPPGSTAPGAMRGPCATDSGDPSKIEPGSNAYAIYSDFRWGELGSTDKNFPPAPPMPPSPPPPPSCAKAYGQCGGKGWSGPTCCPPGQTCQGNEYYMSCAPGSLSEQSLAIEQAEVEAKGTKPAPGPIRAWAWAAWPKFAAWTRRSKVALVD